MANKKFYVDIDLNKNQLLNVVLQNLPSHPTSPRSGQMYYNTVDEAVYGRLGTVWVNLSEEYTHPQFTPRNPSLTGANVLGVLETNAEGHVIQASSRVLTLGDLGYTGDPDSNNYVHPTFPGNDFGPDLLLAEVISNVQVNTEGHVTGFVTRQLTPEDIGAAVIQDSLINLVNTWSSEKINTEINNVLNLVTGALIYKGGYNAQTNTPDLESGTGVNQGFTYVVTTAGDFFTEALQVGDMVVATTDNPTTLGDWTRVNKNIPDIVPATQVDVGISRFGTQAEVNAGVLDDVGVSPATLRSVIEALPDDGGYAANIGNGVATSFDLTHGLNTKDVLVQIMDVATGEAVGATIRRHSTSVVRIVVNEPIGAGELRVLIKKI